MDFTQTHGSDERKLGEILISKGWARSEELERALEFQKTTNRRIGDILVASGIISHNKLFEAMAIQFGLRFVDLKNITIPPSITRHVPKYFVHEYKVMPLVLQQDTLIVAVSDPLEVWPISQLHDLTEIKDIRTVLATPEDIEEQILKVYGPEGVSA